MTSIKHILVTCFLVALLSVVVYSHLASVDIFWAFRETDGSTNWQYIANFSSSLLIIALSVTAVDLPLPVAVLRDVTTRSWKKSALSWRTASRNAQQPWMKPT